MSASSDLRLHDVVAQPVRRSRKWEVPEGSIGAWIAESDFGTYPGIQAALHEAIDEEMLAYLPDRDAGLLRASFSDFVARRYRWAVDPGQVKILPDVLTGLEITLKHLSPDGAVIIPTPAYSPFFDVARTCERSITQAPMRHDSSGWHLDLDRIDDAFTAGARLLILCNPHNPTGAVSSRSELVELSTIVERHGGRVFADEIHAPVIYRGEHHVPYASLSTATQAHTITAMSPSKGWNIAGLKSAQLVLTNEADIRKVDDSLLLPPHLGSTLGAIAGRHAYSEGGEHWLDSTVLQLERNRDTVAERLGTLLPHTEFTPPAGTYLAWIDLSGYPTSTVDAAEYLAQAARVVVSSGNDNGRGYSRFIRLNFALAPDELEEALDRICTALER